MGVNGGGMDGVIILLMELSKWAHLPRYDLSKLAFRRTFSHKRMGNPKIEEKS